MLPPHCRDTNGYEAASNNTWIPEPTEITALIDEESGVLQVLKGAMLRFISIGMLACNVDLHCSDGAFNKYASDLKRVHDDV